MTLEEYSYDQVKAIQKQAAMWMIRDYWEWDNGRLGDDWEEHHRTDHIKIKDTEIVVFKNEFAGCYVSNVSGYRSSIKTGLLFLVEGKTERIVSDYFGTNGSDWHYMSLMEDNKANRKKWGHLKNSK